MQQQHAALQKLRGLNELKLKALEHDSGQLWARVNVLARHSRRAAPAAGWLVCHETARR